MWCVEWLIDGEQEAKDGGDRADADMDACSRDKMKGKYAHKLAKDCCLCS